MMPLQSWQDLHLMNARIGRGANVRASDSPLNRLRVKSGMICETSVETGISQRDLWYASRQERLPCCREDNHSCRNEVREVQEQFV